MSQSLCSDNIAVVPDTMDIHSGGKEVGERRRPIVEEHCLVLYLEGGVFIFKTVVTQGFTA